MRIRSYLMVAAAAGVAAGPVTGQTSDEEFWGGTWFWGAQAGTFLYSANGLQTGVAVGGHWYITSGRTAFSIAFDQLILPSTSTQIGTQPVTYSSGQRLQATLYATPSLGNLQIFAGGGFALHNLTDAAPTGTFGSAGAQTAAEDQVATVATKAFAILGGGVQYRIHDKFVVFGQYQFMPGTGDFLITSGQHLIQGGLRYALTRSKEVVQTER